MHKPSALKNETHQLLRGFEIQADHLIRRPDPSDIKQKKKIKKKENLPYNRLCCLGRSLRENQRKQNQKEDQYLDFDWKLKKLWNMKVTVTPIVISTLGMIQKDWVERNENWWTCENHPHFSIFNIGQITEKSPGDLRKLM